MYDATLHTYQPSETELQKGWRLGVAAAWVTLRDLGFDYRALHAIEELGNRGPERNLHLPNAP